MEFDGVVKSMMQLRVTGRNLPGGEKAVPQLSLRFRTPGILVPTSRATRRDGLTGFAFDLPGELHDLTWEQFLSEFHGGRRQKIGGAARQNALDAFGLSTVPPHAI